MPMFYVKTISSVKVHVNNMARDKNNGKYTVTNHNIHNKISLNAMLCVK